MTVVEIDCEIFPHKMTVTKNNMLIAEQQVDSVEDAIERVFHSVSDFETLKLYRMTMKAVRLAGAKRIKIKENKDERETGEHRKSIKRENWHN